MTVAYTVLAFVWLIGFVLVVAGVCENQKIRRDLYMDYERERLRAAMNRTQGASPVPPRHVLLGHDGTNTEQTAHTPRAHAGSMPRPAGSVAGGRGLLGPERKAG